MWQHAQQRVEHRLRDYLACTQTMTIIAESLLNYALYLACTQTMDSIAASFITSLNRPSKHVEVAPHAHHAVTVSPARRGARIELLPLLLCRREPKELIRETCTVQHAHTRVSLK